MQLIYPCIERGEESRKHQKMAFILMKASFRWKHDSMDIIQIGTYDTLQETFVKHLNFSVRDISKHQKTDKNDNKRSYLHPENVGCSRTTVFASVRCLERLSSQCMSSPTASIVISEPSMSWPRTTIPGCCCHCGLCGTGLPCRLLNLTPEIVSST
jgi:hypothetical protein